MLYDSGKRQVGKVRNGIREFKRDPLKAASDGFPGFDEKILALYAKGMTTRDIQEIVKDLYDIDVSPTLVSEITADLDQEVTACRSRRLDPVWPIVYLDGIIVHVRGENGRVRSTRRRSGGRSRSSAGRRP
ncbi:MAG TPA: transposase [Fimbriiglobus sp.]|jgi:hypothetical protein